MNDVALLDRAEGSEKDLPRRDFLFWTVLWAVGALFLVLWEGAFPPLYISGVIFWIALLGFFCRREGEGAEFSVHVAFGSYGPLVSFVVALRGSFWGGSDAHDCLVRMGLLFSLDFFVAAGSILSSLQTNDDRTGAL